MDGEPHSALSSRGAFRAVAEDYRTVLEATPDGFSIVDTNGRILDVNAAFCRMTGYSREELLTMSVSQLEAIETKEEIATRIKRVVANGSERFETRHRAKSGAYFDVEMSVVYLAESGHIACLLRDVTERKLAEAELLQSERRLRLVEAAIEAAANAIVLCDREGTILWTNRAFSTLTGWECGEVLGKTPGVLRSGKHDRAFYQEMWATILRGDVWRGELTNRRKDGSLYVEEMTITPLRDEAGHVTHLIAIKQDIEWRREAERKLRESERRFRELVQGLDAVVWEADPETWHARFISEPVERILGYPVERWLSEESFFLDHLHPADRARFEAQKNRKILDSEDDFRILTADGRWIWLHGKGRIDAEEAGRASRMSGVFVDVTKHRELEVAVAAAAEEWVASFDSLKGALLVLDSSGRVLRFNRAAAILLGAAYDACIGRTLGELGHTEPWTAALEAVAQARTDGLTDERRADDSLGRVWNVYATRVSSAGTWDGRMIVSLREVTQLVRLQEAVQRAEAMAALGSLVGTVAHEVRNPLFAMSVNIDALAIILSDREDVRELLGALCCERDRTVKLMEDLLQYGRPASTRRLPGGLEPILAASVIACGPVANRLGVTIERTGDASGLEMLLDAGRLQEVFQNLLENACQHSSMEGTVSLDVRVCENGVERHARCTVRDHGPGFSPDILVRLFEPFFTKRKGGIGLGLSIVQRIVEEHGGQVLATNAPDGGAEVMVDLPLLAASGAGTLRGRGADGNTSW